MSQPFLFFFIESWHPLHLERWMPKQSILLCAEQLMLELIYYFLLHPLYCPLFSVSFLLADESLYIMAIIDSDGWLWKFYRIVFCVNTWQNVWNIAETNHNAAWPLYYIFKVLISFDFDLAVTVEMWTFSTVCSIFHYHKQVWLAHQQPAFNEFIYWVWQ